MPSAQRAEHAVELRAHEVREREPAVGGAHEQRPALGEPGDRLAREVVVGEQAAGVGFALERLAEQRLEHGIGVDR